jgi:hypothetical protein
VSARAYAAYVIVIIRVLTNTSTATRIMFMQASAGQVEQHAAFALRLLARATATVETPPLPPVAATATPPAAAVSTPAMPALSATAYSAQQQQPQQLQQPLLQQRQHQQLLLHQQQQVSSGPYKLLQLKAHVGGDRLLAAVQAAQTAHKMVYGDLAVTVVQLETALRNCIQQYRERQQEVDCVLGVELVHFAQQALERCKTRHTRDGDVLKAWVEVMHCRAQEAVQTLQQVYTAEMVLALVLIILLAVVLALIASNKSLAVCCCVACSSFLLAHRKRDIICGTN